LGKASPAGPRGAELSIESGLLHAQDNDKIIRSDKSLHFAPKAKRVIYLYQAGGPSHLETFDYKPALAKLDGQAMPESFTRASSCSAARQAIEVFGPRFGFKRFGKSGIESANISGNRQCCRRTLPCSISVVGTINHDRRTCS